ncbi:IS1634 family transposase (plasmid) [Nostoc sp. UHCC 0926]|uniref:IS1634 family transposase n=1 Tax=Nostoc sp. UHCC 0926 TaxID=3025190 RepID=UPI002360FA5C|nr:IS1634 family transposase [Nostoc sp. UHCC 0926]WDD31979.1 IS1634 family transposase [Nostoc sp. UHCC 0926]WDD32073.1 IS1634 family transposase [Nostoc sp. UHCC 0926]WDD32504.1 IS1634 family transposase [Nostoc sp. UHCC 0926]WDD32941.1 IS1634 family transposase [Nostoc sp. UHCC 0926]WDD32956.1 IS1634 family transposase [Nostoc sp. UHCC 0926]
MTAQKEEPFIKNLAHLGIVAGIIDEIGIVEKINDLLGTDPRERVNAGEVGNESDKAAFGKILVEYSKQINLESIMVADSALYSENNLKLMENIKWISRVPLTIKKAKNLVKRLTNVELKKTEQKEYSYQEEKVTYGGIEQRWILVESPERKKADLKKLSLKIQSESIKVTKQIAKLVKEEFDHSSSAMSKIKEIESKLKYHQITEIQIIQHQTKEQKVFYKVCAKLIESQELITENQNSSGRFILATNIRDMKDLDASEILRIYKQQQSCERGFRFLKDPLFFADSLFVKNPERVETMMMLMGLCLLVYNLGQRQLRSSLKIPEATVKNQLNKLTECPTLRWIFQCFQGIHVLILQGIKRIINLTKERCRILQFLPTFCHKYYLLA